jgi:hypothetical protein
LKKIGWPKSKPIIKESTFEKIVANLVGPEKRFFEDIVKWEFHNREATAKEKVIKFLQIIQGAFCQNEISNYDFLPISQRLVQYLAGLTLCIFEAHTDSLPWCFNRVIIYLECTVREILKAGKARKNAEGIFVGSIRVPEWFIENIKVPAYGL